jgi:heat shock protein HspQ
MKSTPSPFQLRKILNDASLREGLLKELTSEPYPLEDILTPHLGHLNSDARHDVLEILDTQNRQWLMREWKFLLQIKQLHLEKALHLISLYQHGANYPNTLNSLLNHWVDRFYQVNCPYDPLSLTRFIFDEVGLRRCGQPYLDPLYGNAVYALEEKKSWPVLLCSITILLADKLNISMRMVDIPGSPLFHFWIKGKRFYVDPYSGGQLLEETELLQIHQGEIPNLNQILRSPIDDLQVLTSLLRDLNRAYIDTNQDENASLFRDLLELTRSTWQLENTSHEIKPSYKPGDIIWHMDNGFRGVIVNADMHCQASEEWYKSKPDHPERDQPWYHVLVSDSQKISYVAQSKLLPTHEQTKVEHPLLDYFFSEFNSVKYIRNARLWPVTHM